MREPPRCRHAIYFHAGDRVTKSHWYWDSLRGQDENVRHAYRTDRQTEEGRGQYGTRSDGKILNWFFMIFRQYWLSRLRPGASILWHYSQNPFQIMIFQTAWRSIEFLHPTWGDRSVFKEIVSDLVVLGCWHCWALSFMIATSTESRSRLFYNYVGRIYCVMKQTYSNDVVDLRRFWPSDHHSQEYRQNNKRFCGGVALLEGNFNCSWSKMTT